MELVLGYPGRGSSAHASAIISWPWEHVVPETTGWVSCKILMRKGDDPNSTAQDLHSLLPCVPTLFDSSQDHKQARKCASLGRPVFEVFFLNRPLPVPSFPCLDYPSVLWVVGEGLGAICVCGSEVGSCPVWALPFGIAQREWFGTPGDVMGPSEDLDIGIDLWRSLSLKGRGLSVGTEGLVRKGYSPGKCCGKADLEDVFLSLLIVSSQRPVSKGQCWSGA